MEPLDPAAVLEAAAAWIWYPDDSVTVDTDEYLVLAMRPAFASPTQVLRTASERPPADLIAEVRRHLGALGRERAAWWVHDRTRPTGLEAALVATGAPRDETLTVLARALDDAPPRASPVEVRVVADLAGLRDWDTVQVEAFGGAPASAAELDRDLAALLVERDAGRAASMVGYLDDVPVTAGGVSLASGFARLWGGATVVGARGRGAYGAVLRARTSWAAAHGAHAALSKGRVETSAPILRAAGFAAYGEERSYLLPA